MSPARSLLTDADVTRPAVLTPVAFVLAFELGRAAVGPPLYPLMPAYWVAVIGHTPVLYLLLVGAVVTLAARGYSPIECYGVVTAPLAGVFWANWVNKAAHPTWDETRLAIAGRALGISWHGILGGLALAVPVTVLGYGVGRYLTR